MKSKTNLLFGVTIFFIAFSAITHFGNMEVGLSASPPIFRIFYLINSIILIAYITIIRQLYLIKKPYLEQLFFSSEEIKRFRRVAIILILLIPLTGLIEVLDDLSSYPHNWGPLEHFLNFMSYTLFKSSPFLFGSLIIFILIDFISKAEKNRTELEEII
jgi:hypothetical protein